VAHEDRRLRLEFSLVTGARAGDGQVGVGLGALPLFDAAGWLAGFGAAARGYQGVTGGPVATALELAVVGGRRFRFGSIALDLMAGPVIAVRGFGTSVVSRTADGSGGAAMPPPVDDGPWTRVMGGARVTFRTRSLVRTFAGLEGDVALERSTAALPAGEARLPAWTAGVVLGVTVGTP
jgi:hypothetical protein